MSPAKVDVVIVGAGLSGLRAATDIHQAGLSYVVLEAMDRVGGKTLSVKASSQGGRVDLGAAWINDTSQSHMYALAKQYGFDLKEQRDTGLSVLETEDGTVQSMPHSERPSLVSPGFYEANPREDR
jgi:monoamine oxidase